MKAPAFATSAIDRVRTGARNLWSKVPRIKLDLSASSSVDSPVATYYFIVVPAVVLGVIGLVMAFSSSVITNISGEVNPYRAFVRPAIIILGSFGVAVFAHRIRTKRWWQIALVAYVGAIGFQALVATPLGVSAGGNTNWVRLPGLGQIQPSEFLKVALALYLGHILTRKADQLQDLKTMFLWVGLPVGAALGAVMLGHDLGTALVVLFIALGAMWVAGIPAKWFAWAAMALIPAMALVVAQNPTRLQRILNILPGNRPVRDLSAPTQEDHAQWAFGSGGILGLGPGASKEKWNYLQAAHTDMILAVVGEEFGLVGSLTVIACLLLLIYGMIRLIRQSPDMFVSVTTAGIASWILVQSIINISSVTAFGPVIGVPLPLVSYGGSAFLFTALGLAMVAAFAREQAGMSMWGRPDEASVGRDPRKAPRKRAARPARSTASAPRARGRIGGAVTRTRGGAG